MEKRDERVARHLATIHPGVPGCIMHVSTDMLQVATPCKMATPVKEKEEEEEGSKGRNKIKTENKKDNGSVVEWKDALRASSSVSTLCPHGLHVSAATVQRTMGSLVPLFGCDSLVGLSTCLLSIYLVPQSKSSIESVLFLNR